MNRDRAERIGGCACGAVRFRIGAPIYGVAACYCRACQYSTGGGPNYVLLAPRTAFEVTQGEPQRHRVRAESGNAIARAFCGECGTPLWSETTDGTPWMPVKVGALDDPADLEVTSAVFVCEAQPWHMMHEGARAFDKMPPPRR